MEETQAIEASLEEDGWTKDKEIEEIKAKAKKTTGQDIEINDKHNVAADLK